MAKINPIKVKQEADKEEKAGRLDKAIALYRQIVEDNPRDWNTINKVGDLYAKLNKNKEAGEEYAKVADFYAKDGFLLKAIAIWKKINKLDASALEPYQALADLYAKQGLMMEAKSQYQTVVDEYVKRGRAKEAGDVLKKMAEIDPADLKIRSKLADLYTREGNTGKAIEEHIAIAEDLHRRGHLAEAAQVLEKGLKIDGKSQRLRSELARVYLLQKNYEKAAENLEEAVRQSPSDTKMLGQLGEAYLGSRKIEEAEAIFKRLLELDPNDQEARVQMGRVALSRGELDQAYEEFLPVVDGLVEKKEGEKAAALLQQIAQKNPAHIKTLVKLAEIYRILQKDTSVISTYSQLTEAYVKENDFEQAAAVLEILVEMEPQTQQHKNKLQFVRGKQDAASPGPAASPSLEEDFELPAPEDGLALGESEPEPAPSMDMPVATGPVTAPTIQLSGALSDEDKEFIEEHLAEGRVFRKYGLVDKALDQFESVIARFADNVEARSELKDAYREKGQAAKAAEQCLALSEIHRLNGDTEAAEAAFEEARTLAPDIVPVAAPAPAPEPAYEAPEEIPEAPAVEMDIPLEVEEGGLEAGTDTIPVPEELPSLDLGATSEPEMSLDSPQEEAPADDMGLDLGSPFEASEDLPLGGDELAVEEEAPPPPPPPPPPPKPAPAKVAPPLVAKPPPPKPVVAAPPKPTPALVAKAPPPPPAAPAAPEVPADLQRVLDEVDSYISLGFVDDAKEALREIGARYPGHPAILDKIGELGIDQEVAEEPAFESEPEPALPEPAPEFEAASDSPFGDLGDLTSPEPEPEPAFAEPEPPPPTDGGIDLGAELGDLFGAQSAVEEVAPEASSTELGDAGLADIFREFKKGVDKQLGKEDYDTRYNLGIAYKEMGLVDEAIAEFQLAAKDENRILECSSMLGICFMEKGMPKLAVKWFEKGLKVPGRKDEEYQGLRYDLAMAYEAGGEADRALSLFTDLYGQDANFRDVATKVRDLRAALG